MLPVVGMMLQMYYNAKKNTTSNLQINENPVAQIDSALSLHVARV